MLVDFTTTDYRRGHLFVTDSLVAVTGSVTRAYSLSVLAGTRLPQTAYRIARLAGLSPPNVYVELRRLEKAGVVSGSPAGWMLVDEKVRALCEGSGPLYRLRFALEGRGRTFPGVNSPLRVRQGDLTSRKSRGRESRLLREFSQSPTKNPLLAAAGLRQSRHRKR